MKIPLSHIAHTRSGDKGDTCNIGVIALDQRHYPILLREVTPERLKRHFGNLVHGDVERFELPNLGALNLVRRDISSPRLIQLWRSASHGADNA